MFSFKQLKRSRSPHVFSDPNSWQDWYRQHRARVLNAKSVVNSLAPQPEVIEEKPLTFMDLFEQLTICTPVQKGQVTAKHVNVPDSKRYNHLRRNPLTMQRRRRFRRRKKKSQPVQPEIKTPTTTDLHITPRVFKRYEELQLPPEILLKLLRPKIYLEMFLKDLRPLGTIVIQLFTEACPQVVAEFVHACYDHQPKLFSINRLFPPLWLEGELALPNSMALNTPTLEHDMSILDHGSRRGILSFPCRYLRGSKRCFISFSISFKPLSVLNGRRVAFGFVKEGLWVLDTLQNYGSSIGKPTKEIIVSKCTVQF